jgi:hypothetical protein
VVEKYDTLIAKEFEQPLRKFNPSYLDRRVEELTSVGFHTITEIDHELKNRGETLVKFARAWLARPEADPSHTDVPRGISLFYLYYITLATIPEDEYEAPGKSLELVGKWGDQVRNLS